MLLKNIWQAKANPKRGFREENEGTWENIKAKCKPIGMQTTKYSSKHTTNCILFFIQSSQKCSPGKTTSASIFCHSCAQSPSFSCAASFPQDLYLKMDVQTSNHSE